MGQISWMRNNQRIIDFQKYQSCVFIFFFNPDKAVDLSDPRRPVGRSPLHPLGFAFQVFFCFSGIFCFLSICQIFYPTKATFQLPLFFSLLSVLYVWLLRPVMRIVETVLAIFRRFWVVLLNATLAPVCDAVGGIFKAAPRLVQSA